MAQIAINASEEYQRVEKLRLTQERTIVKQYMLFVQRCTQPHTLEKIEQLSLAPNHNDFYSVLDSYIEQFSNVLPFTYLNAANAEIDVWLNRMGVVTKAAQFNVTRRQVSEFLEHSRLAFVRNLTRQQRTAISEAITEGLRRGRNTKQIARMFEDSIGLTPEQNRMVMNYRLTLEHGSSGALRRQLRDQRYDDRLSTAITEGEALTDAQIERMVKAYARNLKRHRAAVIAQTESLRMLNEARNEAVRQAAAAAGVDPTRATKTWQTTLDGRERPTHRLLDGETVGIDDYFQSSSGARLRHPGDTSLGAPPEEIINCRCSLVYNFED